jgi:type II secretory pathway component GspD/PulD (secretin)
MKKSMRVRLPAIFAITVTLGANTMAQTTEPSPAVEMALPSTLNAAEFPAGEGLRLKFVGAPLAEVLSYMSSAAGFTIYFRPGVQVEGRVDMISEQPLGKEEAVNLLETVLSDHGYGLIREGRTLTVLKSGDMNTETQIRIGNDPARIPRNAQIVTQIIPVRTLNPVELQKMLIPLLPAGARLEINESANSLLLTDTQAGIHRVAELIAALDSVSASANTLRVFPLHYADAKTLAGLIKELFAADTASTGNARNPGRGNTIRMNQPGGLRGAFPGGLVPGPNQSAADNGETPVSRVAAVADEHGNAVIISAPEALLGAIAELIATVDMPVEDVTEVRVYELNNADAVELANTLANLFPDDSNSSDAGGRQIQFGGQGGRGAQAPGARQGTPSSNNNPSGRMQKLGRVLAVPDARTGSLLVSAAKSLMPQIDLVVTRLDALEGNKLKTHIIPIQYADVWEVQRMLQDLFPSGMASTVSATQTDPFQTRATTMWSTQFSSGAGSGTVQNTGPGAGGGRGGL